MEVIKAMVCIFVGFSIGMFAMIADTATKPETPNIIFQGTDVVYKGDPFDLATVDRMNEWAYDEGSVYSFFQMDFEEGMNLRFRDATEAEYRKIFSRWLRVKRGQITEDSNDLHYNKILAILNESLAIDKKEAD